MSYPKRAKGWRRLTVEGQSYRWHLKSAGSAPAQVRLQGDHSSGPQVVVTLHGWHDVWLFIGHFDKLGNNPPSITARFAAQVVRFARSHGWNPDKSGPPFYLDYENDTALLSLVRDGTQHSIKLDTSSNAKQAFLTFRELSVEGVSPPQSPAMPSDRHYELTTWPGPSIYTGTTLEQLAQHLEATQQHPNAQVWIHTLDGQSFGVYFNRDFASIGWVTDQGDSADVCDPDYSGHPDAMQPFTIENGQLDEYPQSRCVPKAEGTRALLFFLEHGHKPEWLHWRLN